MDELAPSGRCTRRARCRGTRSPPRPASPCSAAARRRRVRDDSSARATAPRRRPARRAHAAPGSPCRSRARGTLVGLFFAAGRCTTTTTPSAPTTRRTRASSTDARRAASTSRPAATRRCSRASPTRDADLDRDRSTAAPDAADECRRLRRTSSSRRAADAVHEEERAPDAAARCRAKAHEGQPALAVLRPPASTSCCASTMGTWSDSIMIVGRGAAPARSGLAPRGLRPSRASGAPAGRARTGSTNMTNATIGGSRNDPRSRSRTTNPLLLGVSGRTRARAAAGRIDRRRPSDLAELHDRVARGSWVNSKSSELRVAAADLVGVADQVLRDLGELGEPLSSGASSLGRASALGDERLVDRRLHVGGFDVGDLLALLVDGARLLDASTSSSVGTTSLTSHAGTRPLSVLSGDAVVIHSEREHDHEAHEAGERDEEAEPGAEVGAEEEVDRPAEQRSRRTTTTRTPRIVGYQRFLSTVCSWARDEDVHRCVLEAALVLDDRSICSSVRVVDEVRHAARRDAPDAVGLVRSTPWATNQSNCSCDAGRARELAGRSAPSVRLGPNAPPPIGPGSGRGVGVERVVVRPALGVAAGAVGAGTAISPVGHSRSWSLPRDRRRQRALGLGDGPPARSRCSALAVGAPPAPPGRRRPPAGRPRCRRRRCRASRRAPR